MKELLNCARAFFIRDAQNALSYRFAFVYGQVVSMARTLVLWLPAQLVGDNPIFKDQGGFLAYSVTGSVMLGLFMASYGGFATSIGSERRIGTLEPVFATGAPLSGLLLGGSTWTFAHSLLDVVLNLGIATWIFGLKLQGSILSILPIVVLTSLTFVAFGLFSAAFTVLFKQGDPFRMIIGAGSALFGGVFYPSEVLPKFVSWIGPFLPITYGARAMRGVILRGDSLMQHWSDLFVLILFCGALLPLGIGAFYYAVRRAKLDGTLYQY